MSQEDNNTKVIDLGNYGAAQATYSISGYGTDTITLDNSMFTSGTSITTPYTITTTGTGYNWGNTGSNVHINADGLTMKEGADIKIGGKSLTEAIEKIEERLGILNPNPELEDRWDKLKELRKQYMELEKDLLEKEKIMKILKEK
jgi:hypothetical protein